MVSVGATGQKRRLIAIVCWALTASAPALSLAAPHAAPAAASEPDDGYYDRSPLQPAPASTPTRVETGPLAKIDAPADQGVAGYASVFFVRPQRAGADVAGHGRALADAFCREQGLGPALSYGGNGHALRDVLCRRK
jgi:hypothetical protein